MVNGFVSLKISSSYELNLNDDRLIQPLRSMTITATSSLLRVDPPQLFRIGTLTLEVSAPCVSPFTSKRLVPAVPCRSPNETHATFTPDAIYPVIRFLIDFSWDLKALPILTSFCCLSTRQRWFRVIRLSHPHLPSFKLALYPNAHDHYF